MVGRSRRKHRRPQLMGNHQKCWLYGRHVVLETLRAGKWPVLELRMSDRIPADARNEADALAETGEVPVVVESHESLTNRCGTNEHQGFLSKMPPFPYDDPSEAIATATGVPFFVLLDGIQDPYNFGAILRSAEVFGAHAVLVGERNQADVTSLVARSSAGAVNYITIARTAHLVATISRIRERGVRIVAADVAANRSPMDCDFGQPTALVIGNESQGVRRELLDLADERVRIPQQGRIGSLNAAASAAVLFYELQRQRIV